MIQRELVALVKLSFILTALYLVLTRAGGSSQVIRAGGQSWVNLIKALQGR